MDYWTSLYSTTLTRSRQSFFLFVFDIIFLHNIFKNSIPFIPLSLLLRSPITLEQFS